MRRRKDSGRAYRLLLLAYPRTFRQRFGRDLEELFAGVHASRAAGRPWASRAAFWGRIIADTVRHALADRLARPRRLPFRLHHARRPLAMSMLLDDLRSAFRAVHQQGGVSLVVLMTLALAIGANSAMFTVVNPVLLRPLPFERPDKVVMLFEREASGQGSMIWG